jgi:hypothetical protein
MASSRDPLTPMTRAFLSFAEEVRLAADIERHIDQSWHRKRVLNRVK